MWFGSLEARSVSKIIVYDTRSRETEDRIVATLENPTAVLGVMDFLLDRADRWHADAFGVPVGCYRFVFYETGDRLGSVSLGSDFIEAQGCGYFFAKTLSSSEMDTLMSHLTLDGLEDF
jgi:hypothetical protein